MIFNFIRSGVYVIEGYIKWFYDFIRNTISPTAHYREKICNACEHNVRGICSECGCIIKAKIRVDFDLDENGKSIDGCPLKKW